MFNTSKLIVLFWHRLSYILITNHSIDKYSTFYNKLYRVSNNNLLVTNKHRVYSVLLLETQILYLRTIVTMYNSVIIQTSKY